MKIKKYQGETEEQVIEMAKEELGNDAIVLSIKKITPTGIFSIIKKPYIELTASYDENKVKIEEKSKNFFVDMKTKMSSNNLEDKLKEKENTIEKLEKRISELEGYLEKAMKSLSLEKDSNKIKYKNQLVQFIYEMLISKGVHTSVCDDILEGIDKEENQNIDLIVKVVYNKIVKILENSACKELAVESKNNSNEAKCVVFLGTTGVGKTTTIAKLSSDIIINNGKKVGFITSDTYRIAAVDQLKTYAEILGSQVEVVYSAEDVKEKIDKLKLINDYIFFDTAGRSHKNQKNMNEIKELLKEIDNPEVYLVISSTNNFEDVENIINTYSKFSEFNIIFTKIDETDTVGTILNIAYKTNNKIAYVTVGQNVPSDIERFSGEKIAKVLLGSMYK
ncbi:flagellar biosynthesis protein FlhF [uncultured Tyzzerella sp.]|uniref:flagellar biosynthesis protein FlhF n=1 Tax=uncultured Tyzzerella sp. TaxID=2321398 RepID=UPI002942C0E0|nr:flagellar biosynthesis protein FlhF [uncultured Tyzzerella sp.]